MKYTELDKNNLPIAFYDDAINDVIPASAIQITDLQWQDFIDNQGMRQWDNVTNTVIYYKPPFILADAQTSAILRLQAERNKAIIQPIVSSTLGSPHTYSVVSENRNFLNNLISLGIDSKFTCTDNTGIKMRRLHTHAQLMTLGMDIEAVISAHFDHYELKLSDVATATTQAQLDAVVW